jgi:hypothetical protein
MEMRKIQVQRECRNKCNASKLAIAGLDLKSRNQRKIRGHMGK